MDRKSQWERIKAIAAAFKAGGSAIDVAAEFNITRVYVYWCVSRAKELRRGSQKGMGKS